MPYTPSKLPKLTDPDAIALAQYFEDELQSLSRGLVENITELDLSPIFAAPKKPRQGMVVYADGTLWNPGSGEGLYVYSGGGTWVWLEAPAKSFSIVKQLFTSSGTYTPTAGMVFCILEAVGPGGAGGGALGTATGEFTGAGGGAGGYSRKIASAADIGASKAVTVGTGGTAGAANANGNSGSGPTSVGSLCVANAGSGGNHTDSGVYGGGGAGGAQGTGDLAFGGDSGTPGFYMTGVSGTIIAHSGKGASSPFGSGGQPSAGSGSAQAGNPGIGFGSGGSGGASAGVTTSVSGGAGAPGVVFITEFVYA